MEIHGDSEAPDVPPLYRLTVVPPGTDLRAEACRLARHGAEPATLLWADAADRFRCAVILAPDRSFETALLVIYVAMLALRDGLSAAAPPPLEASLGWPDRLLINGVTGGGVAIDAPDDAKAGAVPDWMVVSAEIALASVGEERLKAGGPPVTSLEDEGSVGVTSSALLDRFSRYFLSWINRFQEDGFEPIRANWLHGSPEHGQPVELTIGGAQITGKFTALTELGGLVLDSDQSSRLIDLEQAIRH